MTRLLPRRAGDRTVPTWTPDTALRWAWTAWLLLLVIPAALLAYGIGAVAGSGRAPDPAAAQRWFLVMAAGLCGGMPAAFFWRSRLYRCYWHGHRVPPRAYLKGMLVVWLPLALIGSLAAIGCLATRTLLPNAAAAGVAFAFFLALWPTGHAMVRTTGETDDPAAYEEPR